MQSTRQARTHSHLPVHTFWDIGVGDSTAIWFVRIVGEEYHVVDFYQNSGEGLRHYMKVLKDRGYVRLDKKRLIPEDKGRLVIAFLESFFSRYVE